MTFTDTLTYLRLHAQQLIARSLRELSLYAWWMIYRSDDSWMSLVRCWEAHALGWYDFRQIRTTQVTKLKRSLPWILSSRHTQLHIGHRHLPLFQGFSHQLQLAALRLRVGLLDCFHCFKLAFVLGVRELRHVRNEEWGLPHVGHFLKASFREFFIITLFIRLVILSDRLHFESF